MYETLITNGVEPNRRMLVQKIDETKAMAEQQPQVDKLNKPVEVSKDEEAAAPAQPENAVSPRSDKGGQEEQASNRNSDKNQAEPKGPGNKALSKSAKVTSKKPSMDQDQ